MLCDQPLKLWKAATSTVTTGRLPGRVRQNSGVETLPDYLAPGLDVVFIGINPGLYSVQRGHYFARPTTRFWRAFSASKLSARMRFALGLDVRGPDHDAAFPRFGFGFTDVVKRPSANVADLDARDFERGVPPLVRKLKRYRPRVACFHGLMGYRPFQKWALRSSDLALLGPQPHTIGYTRLFVVPNPSPANAHFTVADQTVWYDRLADFVNLAAAPSAT
jgi:double-stranded uracil-DNA glycosylase